MTKIMDRAVTQWINVDDYYTRRYEYVLRGTFVHHYVMPLTEGWRITTHCHVTGGSQMVSLLTKREANAYLQGFEAF